MTKYILDLVINHPDVEGHISIRDYFKKLLVTLWEDGGGFSGKYPLGNSDWDVPIYEALVKHGFVEGQFDEDGNLDWHSFDEDAANTAIITAIQRGM